MSPSRVRLTRFAAAVVVGLAWLAFAYASVVYVGGALVGAAAGAIALLPRGILWLIAAYQDGMESRAIAGRIATGLAGALAAPQVTLYLVALELVGAAALYGLQRLLRDEARGRTFEEGDK